MQLFIGAINDASTGKMSQMELSVLSGKRTQQLVQVLILRERLQYVLAKGNVVLSVFNAGVVSNMCIRTKLQ
jgi:hypothetical protein